MASWLGSLLLIATLVFTTVYATAPFSIDIDDIRVDTGNQSVKADDDKYRLNNNDVVPSHYDIEITLDTNFHSTPTFKGVVKITVALKQGITSSEKSIYLHAKDITIRECLVTKEGASEKLNVDVPTIDETYEMAEIKLIQGKPILSNGKYLIKIVYEGKLQTNMYGFYISKYKEGSADKYVLATQFQPTHARKLMPCFDEPDQKATFQLTITYPTDATRNYKASSNTELESATPGTGVTTSKFKQTPLMSTYLLAIIISEFNSLEITSKDGTKHAIWNRYKSAEDRSDYSLQISYRILREMNKRFPDTGPNTLPMKKVDHVALPDFNAGAMENWGIVTYREAALIYDERESTSRSKQQICTVISHELAHFWFGNLVTTNWWDNTWLNEGFARYFEYMAANEVEKGFDLENQFIVEQHFAIMNVDSSPKAKSLNSPASSPSQIQGKFSSISYNKGASIIRMMKHWVDDGDIAFNEGLNDYLKTSQSGTTLPSQLWNAMAKVIKTTIPNDKSLANVMDSYVEEAGVPLISVRLDGNKIKLTQSRFIFSDGNQTQPEQFYDIPITYTNGVLDFTDTKPKHWLEKQKDAEISLPLKDPDAVVIVNLQATAYARVNYDKTLWDRILQDLRKDDFGKIHVINRAQIVDDVLNLARADKLDYEFALEIISYLEKETHYYPWYVAFSGFSHLLKKLPASKREELKTFILHLSHKAYTSNAPTDETNHIVSLKKTLLQMWRCELGDPQCIKEMVETFSSWKASNSYVRPDVRSTAYCVALRETNKEENWNFLFKRFKETTLPSEARLIIPALGCTKIEDVLERYLEMSIAEDSDIRSQDAEAVFSAVLAGNPENLGVAVEFFIVKHSDIKKRYGGDAAITSILGKLIDRFTTTEQVKMFREYLETAKPPFQKEAMEMLQTATSNIAWADENIAEIDTFVTSFLNARKPQPPADDDSGEDEKDGGAASVAISMLLVVSNVLIAVRSMM